MKISLLCCSPRSRSVGAFVAFLLGLWIIYFAPISAEVKLVLAVGIIFSYTLFLFWASANIRSGVYVRTFNRAPHQMNKIALTFDDGPDLQTKEVLDLLKLWEVKATFFLIGMKIASHKEVVKRMVQEGHAIGNHSWMHSSLFPLQGSKRIRTSLVETRRAIEQVTGVPNNLFRPPFGVTNPIIAKALKGLSFKVVGWSVRSLDTKNEPTEVVFKRIQSKIKGGDIILLHDTSKNIIPLLTELLPWLKSLNYELVTVEELMKNENKS